MFFPRLRRQAKWVFVFLAFVFAAGFVFFGVGSGSTGLGDLLRGNFNIFGSKGSSTNSSAVKSALKKTQAHPKDPNAWNDLASAYQTDGKLTQANTALEHLLKLRPNDTGALQRVASFYETKATDKETEARNLQAQAPLSLGGDPSITYPIIRSMAKQYSNLSLLHIDAHPDLYDEFQGNRYSHASPFARIMEEKLVKRLVQVGIRNLNAHQSEQANR